MKFTDYRIRSYFPNFHMLRRIHESMKGLPGAKNEGFLPPELEYKTLGDEAWKRVVLDPADLPLLTGDRNESLDHLQLLIERESGDAVATQKLENRRSNYWHLINRKLETLTFVEHEGVIPCTTHKSYSDILLSQKGKVLHELYQQGYPVPDFCVVTSHAYQVDIRERKVHLREAIENLEKMTGEKLGDPDNSLVFAMRCATPHYIPGLMPTYLNVGVTRLTLRSLERRYDAEVTERIYLSNLQTLCQALSPDREFYHKLKEKCTPDMETGEKIRLLTQRIAAIDEQILYDARYQAEVLMQKEHEFFIRNQDLIYTFQRNYPAFPAIILQKMVWTVRSQDSYPGVLYSRHSRTGLGMQIESFPKIFGDEIMTGTIRANDLEYFDREEIHEGFPAIYHFTPMLPRLEEKLKSPATIEFAVESYNGISYFAILQLNMSELTGRSTLLAAVDLYEKHIISRKRVIQLIRPYHLRQIFSDRIDDKSFKSLQFFGSGVSVLPRSAVSSNIYFSMAKALEAKKRGEKVCLCKENFVPSETIFMAELDVILSMNPLAIHVVTACLGYGIPAFLDLKNHGMVLEENALRNKEGMLIREGDMITVSSKHHSIYLGKASYRPARFQKYLQGQKLEMDIKEERVFVNMAKAYKAYQEILNTLETEEATTLPDLVKLVRNDYDQNPEKAKAFVNEWFDANTDYYPDEILKSGLGSHIDQHKIYSLLTTNRKIIFFKKVLKICRERQVYGFMAGAFMLGRFLAQPHPVAFWKAFTPEETVFLLNEYILFEKYMQVLSEFGERNLSRARNRLLNDELDHIALSNLDYENFIPLKLATGNWQLIENSYQPAFHKETRLLIKEMQRPYQHFFNYDQPWSLEKLQVLCKTEGLPVPGCNDK